MLPLWAVLAFLPSSVAAQASAEEPPATESGDDGEVVRMGEIVVEDDRLRAAEIFENTAVETEVIEAKEIQDLPATNLEQVLSTSPGIRTQGRVQGEEAAVSIEGLPPEYTKILVNSQRYSGEIGGVDDLRDFPTLFTGRVEIKRGPQGLRYGTDAAGGVIDIETKPAPSEGVGGTIEALAGDDGAIYGGANVRVRWGDHGFTFTVLNDQIDGFDPPDATNNADNDGSGAGGGGEGPPVVSTQAGGEESRRRSRDVFATWETELSGVTLFADAGFRREEEDFVPVGGGETSTRDQERWRGRFGARSFVGESTLVEGSLTYFDRSVDSAVGRVFSIEEDEWKLDLAVERIIETGPILNVIGVGIDFRAPSLVLDEGELDPSLSGVGIDFGDVDERFESSGFFLIGEHGLDDWLSLEWGARYEWHSRFENKLVAQAALLVAPLAWTEIAVFESLKIRLGWGQNYRTPSLRDLYQPESPQLGGAYFLAGNPELVPENSRGYRLGIEWSPHRVISLAVTGFHNDIEDSIRSVLDRTLAIPTGETTEIQFFADERLLGLQRICEATGFIFPECATLAGALQTVSIPLTRPANVFQKTNLDRVRTRGIEAIVQLRPHRRVVIDLAYTLLDTEVLDADRPDLIMLPNQPKHQIDGRVRVRIPRLETVVGVTGRWRDGAVIETSGTGLLGFSNPTVASESSLILSARITQPIGERFELFVDGNNLTDERVQDSYAIRGRTFFVGFRMRFGADRRAPREEPLW